MAGVKCIATVNVRGIEEFQQLVAVAQAAKALLVAFDAEDRAGQLHARVDLRAALTLLADGIALDAPPDVVPAAEPPWWAGALNRRATVEQWMFDAARGKRAMPTADELRGWAIKLGTPGEGEPTGPSLPDHALRDAAADIDAAGAAFIAGGVSGAERAFQIADEAMFELLHSEGVPYDSPVDEANAFGLVDEQCQEVTTLAASSPAVREAFEWLHGRGYVELGTDGVGSYIRVIRRPCAGGVSVLGGRQR